MLQGKLNIDLAGITFFGSPSSNIGYEWDGTNQSQGNRETNWRDFEKMFLVQSFH